MTMNMTRLVDRLSGLGSDKWRLYVLARDLKAKGQDIIEMTIGEPDIATPKELISVAAEAMEHGRTGYSNGRGEPNLVTALATHYTGTSGAQDRRGSVLVLSRRSNSTLCRISRPRRNRATKYWWVIRCMPPMKGRSGHPVPR